MKLSTDILPRGLWNSCEEILRIERVASILLQTLTFLMAFAMCLRKTTTKRMLCQISESRISVFLKSLNVELKKNVKIWNDGDPSHGSGNL